MVVFSLTQAPQRVRGLLSRYCLEVRSGLFIGRLDKRMRLKLWSVVEEEATMKTSAVMAWSRASDQGYAFRSLGPLARRTIRYDGLWLISTQISGEKPDAKQIQAP